MGTVFDQAVVNVPGATPPSCEGALAIADGELHFHAAGADRDAPPLHSWRMPRLTDGPEGNLLRVFSLLGATGLQVGTLDRLTLITLRGAQRADVERALAEQGYPPVLQALAIATSELASLRNWAIVFMLIGLSNTDQGLNAVTGWGMFAVGLWSLFAGPRVAILAANGLLLLALAAKNMQVVGGRFWPLALGLLGIRQLQRWAELKPLFTDPAHQAWVRAKLAAPRDDAALVPAGYGTRTLAFLLSGGAAALALLYAAPALLTLGHDVRGLPIALLLVALTGWYLLVTVYPASAARAARRVLPASGPIAVLLFPFVLGCCALVILASLFPVAPASP